MRLFVSGALIGSSVSPLSRSRGAGESQNFQTQARRPKLMNCWSSRPTSPNVRRPTPAQGIAKCYLKSPTYDGHLRRRTTLRAARAADIPTKQPRPTHRTFRALPPRPPHDPTNAPRLLQIPFPRGPRNPHHHQPGDGGRALGSQDLRPQQEEGAQDPAAAQPRPQQAARAVGAAADGAQGAPLCVGDSAAAARGGRGLPRRSQDGPGARAVGLLLRPRQAAQHAPGRPRAWPRVERRGAAPQELVGPAQAVVGVRQGEEQDRDGELGEEDREVWVW